MKSIIGKQYMNTVHEQYMITVYKIRTISYRMNMEYAKYRNRNIVKVLIGDMPMT